MPLNLNVRIGDAVASPAVTDALASVAATVPTATPVVQQQVLAGAGARFAIDATKFQFIPVQLPPDRPGPVVTDGAPVCFNDRYDAGTRWYLPEFGLKAPLKDNFSLVCRVAGVDAQAKNVYSGVAKITVVKQMPAGVTALQATSPGINFREIPLNKLGMAFVATLADGSSLPYPAQIVQNGDNEYGLTVQLASQDSLNSFYRFISTPGNNKFCSFVVSGSYFGYTARQKPLQLNLHQVALLNSHPEMLRRVNPVALAQVEVAAPAAVLANPAADAEAATVDDDYDARDALPLVQVIGNVNFDCGTYPLSYVTEADDKGLSSAFGCTPPFGELGENVHQYKRFALLQGGLGDSDYGINQIYRNTYNGNFLVVPERYVIAFDVDDDGQLLRPSAYMFTSIDASDSHGAGSSTATFQFKLAPDVSSYQLLLIKKLILMNLPTGANKAIGDIFIEFPDKLQPAAAVALEPDRIPRTLINPVGSYAHGVHASKLFHLEFQDVAIGNGNAEWVAQRIKLGHGDIIGTLAFDIDCGDTAAPPQSTIDLSLIKVAGNALAVQVDGQGAQFVVNRTLYDLRLSHTQTLTTDGVPMAQTVSVPANHAIPAGVDGIPVEISQTYFNYELRDHAPSYLEQVLNEIRAVNLDSISDDIIVTNNSGLFSMYKIASIDFLASIIKPDEANPDNALCRITKNLAVDGEINHVPFALPVAQYLSKWAAVYSTVINFQDGKQQVNSAQYIDDLNSIGKLINLTVSKLNLHAH
jgi:hypothetical protein